MGETESATPAQPGPQRRILVAEADASAAQMLRELFRDEGWDVAVATDVADARDQLHGSAWTIVLTSSFSPSSQHPEQWRELLSLVRAARGTPVLLLTGHVIDNAMAQQLGVAGIVHKPYDVDQLLARLDELAPRPK